ncbi:MAG: diacylglycerol kinase family protein [Planctomycetota bacterium]
MSGVKAGSEHPITVLFNPKARTGSRVLPRLRSIAAELASELRWVALEELAELREAAGRLIVVGGDGTVNAACRWLLDHGATIPLAIVPVGTGNNLARGLRCPLNPETAFRQALVSHRTRPLDVIRIESEENTPAQLMVQSAALGFPARIAERFERLRKHRAFRFLFRPSGPSVYRLLSVPSLLSQIFSRRDRSLTVRLSLPKENFEETALAIFFGNEGSMGGNFLPCPRAQLDDGLLDICIVRDQRAFRFLPLFRRVMRGEHLELTEEVVYRQSEGPIEVHLAEPAPLLIDGDLPLICRHYKLEVLRHRIQCIVSTDAATGRGLADV